MAPLLATAAQAQTSFERSCEELEGITIDAQQIGLATGGAVIETASVLQEPAENCEVRGAIAPVDEAAPDIRFQVNLPFDWNRKLLQYGGGGYNGSVVTGLDPVKFNPEDAPTPLEQGYVTFGSDSGHQSDSSLDGTFLMNEEALRNFGGEQIKKTRDVAMQLVSQMYDAAPEHTYVQGSSQGGHEAMIAIQRWPGDYDGVIVVHPANSFVGLQLSGNRAAQALYREDAWLDPSDVELLNPTVLEACDALDGAEDGLVSNTAACGQTFEITSLACDDGQPEHGVCFGDAQIEALNVIDTRTETPPLQGGAQGFSGWPIFLGADLYGLWGMGTQPQPTVPPTPVENFGLAVLADPAIRYGILRDPGANSLEFDPSQHAERITELSEITDAVSADMSAFADAGGKVLLLHGTTDFAIPFGNTVEWYERVREEMGPEATGEFMKFWLQPGFGHGSGAFQMRWNSLEALEAWVEEGTPPSGLVATDAAEETAGRSMPLCEYPAYPHATVATSGTYEAADFECRQP